MKTPLVPVNPRLRSALAASADDRIIFDLAAIAGQYDALKRELPDVRVRFALKACPVDEVLTCLADRGAGFDAASPNEIIQALRTGVPVGRIHYGNTVKSDRQIAAAYRLGVRDFATDSLEDVQAVATHAPGARVFCRLATSGQGALWGLSRKYGCSPAGAVRILEAAARMGLTPSGVSFHVGSQQMTAEAWRAAFDDVVRVVATVNRRGIVLDHVNIGGGLPAAGYLDDRGRPLHPPLADIFTAIRAGMQRVRRVSSSPLDFVAEPGRHLVADHAAIRAHVARLSTRGEPDGRRPPWLYLSCGKFNGLYEVDQLHYRMVYPTRPAGGYRPAVIAGPTCDGDDALGQGRYPVPVPVGLRSGDPVWILSCGAYSASYTTQGFNGFEPLPRTVIREPVGRAALSPEPLYRSVSTLAEVAAC